ncbi:MAG: Fic family protein [Mycoplasmataceae bacterium]|jgi:Fic family protein|nr:Fic family protein [Mycoplasmataceae bacterium]
MIERIINLLKNNITFYKKVREDFTYHSSTIEGTTVTREEHTKLANLKFNQTIRDIELSSNTNENDAIENLNCIKLFDYVFENLNQKLDHDTICLYQYILKKDTLLHKNVSEETDKYRKTFVSAGNFDATPPYMIYQLMDQLIKDYEIRFPILLDDIAQYHVRFEAIHPFRDGNGRVGRIIAFKQCLENNIIPFIVDSDTRKQYIDAIYIAQTKNDFKYIIDYFFEQQKTFMIKYREYIENNNILKTNIELLPNERKVLQYLQKHIDAKRIDIQKALKLSERTVKVLLKNMIGKKLIKTIGTNRSIAYNIL